MNNKNKNHGALRQEDLDPSLPPAATPEDISPSAPEEAEREPAVSAHTDEVIPPSRARNLHDEMRASRETENREVDDIYDAQASELLQLQALQTKLPDPPKKTGWHRLWLSMTNSATPPEYFIRLGYRPVKVVEWPGYEDRVDKTGEYAGVIRVKEMLLYEIEEAKWQSFMRILHHKSPAEEEEMLRNNINESFRRDGSGEQMIREIGDGTAKLGSIVRAPQFSEG